MQYYPGTDLVKRERIVMATRSDSSTSGIFEHIKAKHLRYLGYFATSAALLFETRNISIVSIEEVLDRLTGNSPTVVEPIVAQEKESATIDAIVAAPEPVMILPSQALREREQYVNKVHDIFVSHAKKNGYKDDEITKLFAQLYEEAELIPKVSHADAWNLHQMTEDAFNTIKLNGVLQNGKPNSKRKKIKYSWKQVKTDLKVGIQSYFDQMGDYLAKTNNNFRLSRIFYNAGPYWKGPDLPEETIDYLSRIENMEARMDSLGRVSAIIQKDAFNMAFRYEKQAQKAYTSGNYWSAAKIWADLHKVAEKYDLGDKWLAKTDLETGICYTLIGLENIGKSHLTEAKYSGIEPYATMAAKWLNPRYAVQLQNTHQSN